MICRCLTSLLLLVCAAASVAAEVKPLEFKQGDRIAWVGGALVERDQLYGYLETLLTTRMPEKKLTFRNLGWSGDTAEGTARAVFGAPQDGFQRLLKDIKDAQPTLILVCYGANEAHAGERGVAKFEADLAKVVDALSTATGARIALVTPHRQQFVDPQLPDPSIYNNKLPPYLKAVEKVAAAKNAALVDVSDLVAGTTSQPDAPRLPRDIVTENGIHFTEYGYWKMAPEIAQKMGVQVKTIDVVIDLDTKSHQASGAKLADVAIAADKIKFTATSEHLPLPPAPVKHTPTSTERVAMRLTVKGLPKDKQWTILCDGEPVELTGDDYLEHGGLILTSAETAQVEQLRRTINQKNEYWFHRHRPQNETYLFLFRKHEQGNNAVEIPQFDPLIEAEEKKIAELSVPKPRVYEIKVKK